MNRDRFLQALQLDLAADPTGGTCVDTANNGSTVGCAPMNIFGPGNISDDAAAFLRTAVAAEGEFEQRVWAASFAGDLFNLPAGAVARPSVSSALSSVPISAPPRTSRLAPSLASTAPPLPAVPSTATRSSASFSFPWYVTCPWPKPSTSSWPTAPPTTPR